MYRCFHHHLSTIKSIADLQDFLRLLVPLFGGSLKQPYSLRLVCCNAIAIVIAHTKVELSICQPLIGGFAIPLYCLRLVDGDTLTIIITASEVVLRLRMLLHSGLKIPLHGTLKIL